MASSQTQRNGPQRNRRGGSRSGQSRNRSNKNRKDGGRQESSRQGGYIKSKVPRRAPQPSFGQKLLKFISFGFLGGKVAEPEKKAAADRREEAPPSRPGASAEPRNNGEKRRTIAPERRSRAPEVVEVTSSRLYVGNLSYDAAESDLIELFSGVGSVDSAEVVSHRHTQRSKGYAFVTMTTTEEAKRAVEVLHDKDFMGRKLVVSGAKSAGVRDAGEGESDGDY